MSEIWDCFFFNGELDVLRFRLAELNSIVDRFVIVESALTFTGQRKPLVLETQLEHLAPYVPKITYVIAQLSKAAPSAWYRENEQRAALRRAIEGGPSDDILLIGDVDELPHRELLPALRRELTRPLRLAMKHSLYFANWVLKSEWLDGPVVCRRSQLQFPMVEDLLVDARPSPAKRGRREPVLGSAGRHLANLGGAALLREKLTAYSHQEQNTERNRRPGHLERCAYYGVHFGGRDMVRRLDASQLDPLLERLREYRADWFNFEPAPRWLESHAFAAYTFIRQSAHVHDSVIDFLDKHIWMVTGPGAPAFATIDTLRRVARRLAPRPPKLRPEYVSIASASDGGAS
jgi:beta-1,4-mannosyl-glycoprotein beta-1,4-N-acetylglucosaminyltransferase